MIQPTSTTIFESKNNDNVVEGYIKQLAWETEYYTLVIRYFSEDGVTFSEENPHVGICNNTPFKIDSNPDSEDSLLYYSGDGVGLYSYLVQAEQELVELSEILKSVANSVELFNQVISERL